MSAKVAAARVETTRKKKGDLKFDAKTHVLDPERKYDPREYHALQAKGCGNELHQLHLEHKAKQQISGVSLSEPTEAEKQCIITLTALYIAAGQDAPSRDKPNDEAGKLFCKGGRGSSQKQK